MSTHNAEIVSEEIIAQARELLAIPLHPNHPKKLQVLKPDVITEAISVELKNIEMIEKQIREYESKIKKKREEITKCKTIIRQLERAKKIKES